MTDETRRFEVSADADGDRLDRFLARAMTARTRSALRRWILDGRVTVDGTPASKPGFHVEPGMVVEARVPPPDPTEAAGEAIPLDVLFEDDHLLCIDKPAGLVVHPGHGCPDGTLVNALIGRKTSLASIGAPQRPGIVHRLDKGTSGVILVAKTDQAHLALADAFAKRTIEKHYVALVWGRVFPVAGSIDRNIGRSRTNPVKMSVRSPRGREARTQYRIRKSIPGFSLLDVRPETGRTHQIRVHLQSINHPIVGDARYGGHQSKGVQDPGKRQALERFDRLALHARLLELDHPVTGERLSFEAPLPGSIVRLLEALRG